MQPVSTLSIVLLVATPTSLILGFFWLKKTLQESLRDFQQGQVASTSQVLTPLMTQAQNLNEASERRMRELETKFTQKIDAFQPLVLDRVHGGLTESRKEMSAQLLQTTQILEKKFEALQLQVRDRLDAIQKNVQEHLEQNLKDGMKNFEKVQELLRQTEARLTSLSTVGEGITELNQLLKLPHLRGGFGEASLERLLSDSLSSQQYELQAQIQPNSTERVDAVVKMRDKKLPIDSKFPRETVLPLFETQDPTELTAARKVLAEKIKQEAKSISQKYIHPEHGTTEFALMFLPSETLYFEVIRDVSLFQDLNKLKVFPVSPNTLTMGLYSVNIAHEYYEYSKQVTQTLEDIKKARTHFNHFQTKFEDVGKGLQKAQDAFNTANTHLSRYGSSVVRLTGSVSADEQPSLPPQI